MDEQKALRGFMHMYLTMFDYLLTVRRPL